MSDLHEMQPRSALKKWKRKEARRRMYMRRRIAALVILLALLTGIGYGVKALLSRWQGPAEAPTVGEQPPASRALSFSPDRFIPGPDLDGDGKVERVAVGPAADGSLAVALVTGPVGKERQIGEAVTVPDAPLRIADLPRAERVLIWEGQLPVRGEPRPVQVGDATAVEAQGGEPDRKAWRLDADAGLVPIDYYEAAAPLSPPEPTVIIVDKGLNVLWYYEDGTLVQTARVATGRHIEGPEPSAENRLENYLTPVGRFEVTLMAPGLPYYKENIPALDPRNPLGTRWIGFPAYPGDNGAVWAIHGTNEPESIGQWVSEGCIRMRNDEVERLYDAVELGTLIVIQNSLAAAQEG